MNLTKNANIFGSVDGGTGGLLAGGFQVSNGISMRNNDDPYDNALGIVQAGGGIATIAGSGITLAGLAASTVSSVAIPAAVIGAAPVLLGVGAIAAGGVLAYNVLKDTKFVDKVNTGLETWAERPNGIVDTAISTGQAMVDSGVPTALAVPLAVADSAYQQAAKGVKNTIDNTIEDVNYALDTVGNAASEWFKPLGNVIDGVSETAASAFSTITSPAKNAVESVSNLIKESTDSLIDTFDNAVSGVSDFVKGIFGSGS